jgi:hypothetical protein
MEGLQVGNECLNKMHQVGLRGAWWAGGCSCRAQEMGASLRQIRAESSWIWIGGCSSTWL